MCHAAQCHKVPPIKLYRMDNASLRIIVIGNASSTVNSASYCDKHITPKLHTEIEDGPLSLVIFALDEGSWPYLEGAGTTPRYLIELDRNF